MNRKDILELKKRFKKDQCTFTKLCGCYVSSEKNIILEFRENFLNLPEEEIFKYLEISKKILSGTVGNNLLQLNFPLDENFNNKKQELFMQIKRSGLTDDTALRELYDSIIESYDYTGNFLILLYHDAYDVITKTTDKFKLDESEEVFEYIMCAICPVELSKSGLGYYEDDRKIKARIRDWVVGIPTLGFVFPAFIDRSSDVNNLIYYTKNAKDPQHALMETALGCLPQQTATIQKETLHSIIKNTVGSDDELCEKVYTEFQENLSSMVEQHKEIYKDTDMDPIALSTDEVKNLLIESGVPEEATERIKGSYQEKFGEDIPLAENLIDSKLLKANAQKKKEVELVKQVNSLKDELSEAKKDSDDEEAFDNMDMGQSPKLPPASNYDVVLHVNPNKLPKIKTQVIDGQRCILVPINDDEEATINGMDDLI